MKRILLVFPGAYLDTVPCVMSTIALLAKHFVVDIFYVVTETFPIPKFSESNIHTYIIDDKKGFIGSLVSQHFGKFSKRILSGIMAYFFLSVLFILHSTQNRYYLVIGVERRGLWIALLISTLQRCRAIYFSLELLFSHELSLKNKITKALERITNRWSVLSIIQDASRSHLLARENGIDLKSIIELPNSSLGSAYYKKTFFLYKKFDIPKDKFLILTIGTLGPWAYSRELALESKTFSPDDILVFHSREKPSDRLTQSLVELKKETDNLILSFQPVESNDLENLVRSADIGIAFYKISDSNPFEQTNVREAGLASGKIAQYLQCGIPVIVNSETNIRSIIEDFDCGIVVHQINHLNEAISQIKANYSYYSRNACRCFDSLFSFEEKFQKFMKKLLSMNLI